MGKRCKRASPPADAPLHLARGDASPQAARAAAPRGRRASVPREGNGGVPAFRRAFQPSRTSTVPTRMDPALRRRRGRLCAAAPTVWRGRRRRRLCATPTVWRGRRRRRLCATPTVWHGRRRGRRRAACVLRRGRMRSRAIRVRAAPPSTRLVPRVHPPTPLSRARPALRVVVKKMWQGRMQGLTVCTNVFPCANAAVASRFQVAGGLVVRHRVQRRGHSRSRGASLVR